MRDAYEVIIFEFAKKSFSYKILGIFCWKNVQLIVSFWLVSKEICLIIIGFLYSRDVFVSFVVVKCSTAVFVEFYIKIV